MNYDLIFTSSRHLLFVNFLLVILFFKFERQSQTLINSSKAPSLITLLTKTWVTAMRYALGWI